MGFKFRNPFGEVQDTDSTYTVRDAHGNITTSASPYTVRDAFGNVVLSDSMICSEYTGAEFNDFGTTTIWVEVQPYWGPSTTINNQDYIAVT